MLHSIMNLPFHLFILHLVYLRTPYCYTESRISILRGELRCSYGIAVPAPLVAPSSYSCYKNCDKS